MYSADFRGILNYIPQFRGKTFVLAVDGGVLDSGALNGLLLDIAMMHSLNMKVVLAHGASKQIGDLAKSRAITPSNTDGTGRTDLPTLKVSIDAITNLTFHLTQQLKQVGVKSVNGSFYDALPVGIREGVELENTGRVSKVDQGLIDSLLAQGLVPIISPLATDESGRTLRLSSHHIAAQTAAAVGAHKLLFLNAVSIKGFLGTNRRELSIEQAIKQGEKSKEAAKAQIKEGVQASRNGVPRVHFLNGMKESALLRELFDGDGIGTMIYADDYRVIRPMQDADIPLVASMMQDSVEDEAVLSRSPEVLHAEIERYFVLEIDKHIVGSIALFPFPDTENAEIGALFIHPHHRQKGNARRLIEFAEAEATKLGCKEVFALTTQAAGFFSKAASYEKRALADLPKARKLEAQAKGRNSYVFFRELQR